MYNKKAHPLLEANEVKLSLLRNRIESLYPLEQQLAEIERFIEKQGGKENNG